MLCSARLGKVAAALQMSQKGDNGSSNPAAEITMVIELISRCSWPDVISQWLSVFLTRKAARVLAMSELIPRFQARTHLVYAQVRLRFPHKSSSPSFFLWFCGMASLRITAPGATVAILSISS